MALLPRKQWTNPLAWAVWKQRQNNKLRGAGLSLYPDGAFTTINRLWYKDPIGGSDATKRYQWHLDGQSMFWSRGNSNYGATVNATLETTFIGSSANLQYLLGRHSNDRFYIATTQGDVTFGNGTAGLVGSAALALGEINHAKLTADGVNVIATLNGVEVYNEPQVWTGVLDEVGFGVKGDQQQEFFAGSVQSFRVATDTEDNPYKLDGNGDYEVSIGKEGDLNSRLTRENAELDGSDIETITRKEDNSGWTGENAVTNGTFDTDLSGWAASNGGWAWDNGKALLSGDGSIQSLRQAALVVGINYLIGFDVDSVGGDIGLENAGGQIVESGSSGRVEVEWVADQTTLSFKRTSGTVTGTLDNITAVPIYNHATGAND